MKLFLWLVLVGCAVSAFAQECGHAVADAKLDAVVAVEMAQQKIPGVAVLVACNGKTIRAQGYGLANLEHQVPMKPDRV